MCHGGRTIACALLAVGTARATAAPVPAYALDLIPLLKDIDLQSPTVATLGPTGAPTASLQSLAITPASQLFTMDQQGMLYDVALTGALTPISPTGIPNVRGLDYDPISGTLLAIESASNVTIWSVSTVGGAAPYFFGSPPVAGAVEAFAIDESSPNYGYVLSTAFGGTDFSVVDFGAGTVTWLSTIPDKAYGLDFASDGNLYAIAWAGATYQINPGDGTFQLVYSTGNEDWTALAARVIPEPAALVLAMAGACPLIVARGHRRRP